MIDLKNAAMPQLKAEVFDLLEGEHKQAVYDGVLLGLLAVNGMQDMSNYTFDVAAIQQVEKFLSENHKRRVLKWGEGEDRLTIKRVLTAAGAKTASKKHIVAYEKFLNVIGLFYSYCLANVTGGKFVIDDSDGGHALGLKPPEKDGLVSFPVGKVFKFLRYGAEDSLVGFCQIIKSQAAEQPHIDHIRNLVLETLKSKGVEVPAGYRWQNWHCDVSGDLQKVVLIGPDSVELAAAYVNEGMFAQDMASVPDEVVREFAKSENGREVLQGTFTRPDANGMCRRADFLDEDEQLEAIRTYMRHRAGQIAPDGATLH